MDNNNINTKFLAFLDYRNKFQDKSIADEILIKMIDGDQPLALRSTKEYKEYINILLNNIDHMYRKSDTIGIYNEFDIEDFSEVFNKIAEKEKFIEGFLIFNDVKNIYTLDTKFQSITDFFTIVLKRDMIEQAIVKFSKEVNEILDTHKNDISKRVQELDQMLQKISEITYTSEAEKQNYSEVFTALFLINQMLDKLPKYVWKNPYLKWLDPANGYGNFPIVVVQRLMEGLEDVVIPETNLSDPELRYKWIMEKMIYVCDINIKNMKIYQELVDREKKLGIKLNYFRGSFLSNKFDSKMIEWGVKEFDIIMGNPPFQKSNVDKGQSHLYPEFIKKSSFLLKKDGLLLFISPPTFLKDKQEVINNMQIILINLKNEIQTLYFPKIGTSICYYLLIKSKSPIKTNFICDDSEFEYQIDRKYLIPLNNPKKESFSIIKKVFDFKTTKKLHFDRNKNPFPKVSAFVRRQNRNKYFNCLKTYDGFDEDVKINQDYTMEKDVDVVVHFLNSKLMSYIYFQYSTSPFITKGFFNSIPYPEIDIASYSNDEIYKLYNLTEEEINIIENTISETPVKLEKSVGATIAEDAYDFKIGEKYEYTGRSKTIKKGEVELVKILKTTFRIKDNIGNVLDVKKSTLKIKN